MSYTITIVDTGEEYACRDTQHLLAGMQRLGKKGIPVGCRSGGCGVCKIHILSGEYYSRKMSREHVSEQDETAGVALACRVYPNSDIELRVLGKMEKAVTGKQRKIP
jgi:ferredoxin